MKRFCALAAPWLTLVVFLGMPRAAAADPVIQVTPASYDFGEVEVGHSKRTTITVSNVGDQTLTVTNIRMLIGITPGAVASVTVGRTPPFDIAAGGSAALKVTFTAKKLGQQPGRTTSAHGTIFIDSNSTGGSVGFTFDAILVPSAEMMIADIIAMFDQAVADGTLTGTGGLIGAAEDLKIMAGLLSSAQFLIVEDKRGLAFVVLVVAYLQCDGLPWPEDLVAGEARPELAGLIVDLIERLVSR
jgi:hypothetical protein